jgi:hypothetical protein
MSHDSTHDINEIAYMVKPFVISQLRQMTATFQRPLDFGKVNQIVKNWDPRVWTMPDVFVTSDGKMYLGEGQHRVAAAEKVFGPDATIDCRLIETDSPGDMFIKLSTSKVAITQINRFTARLEGDNDPVAVGMDAIARMHGLVIARSTSPYAINGVGILQNLYEENPTTLSVTLHVISQVITKRGGDERGWTNTKLLRALFYVIGELHCDPDKLIERLVTRVPAAVAQHPTNDLRANVEDIVSLYNAHRQARNRVDPYSSRLWQKS